MRALDRRLIAVIGAGVVLVTATLIIVFLAIVPVPEFEPLQAGEQSGLVAYIADDEDHPVRIIDLESMSRVSADLSSDVSLVGWHGDGSLIVADWRSPDGQVLIDPHTGQQVGSVDGETPESRQTRVFPEHSEGAVVLTHPTSRARVRLVAPDSYDIRDAVAVGGDRIVFVDELGRVAIIYVGEDEEPKLVAEDAAEWGEVVARP